MQPKCIYLPCEIKIRWVAVNVETTEDAIFELNLARDRIQKAINRIDAQIEELG